MCLLLITVIMEYEVRIIIKNSLGTFLTTRGRQGWSGSLKKMAKKEIPQNTVPFKCITWTLWEKCPGCYFLCLLGGGGELKLLKGCGFSLQTGRVKFQRSICYLWVCDRLLCRLIQFQSCDVSAAYFRMCFVRSQFIWLKSGRSSNVLVMGIERDMEDRLLEYSVAAAREEQMQWRNMPTPRPFHPPKLARLLTAGICQQETDFAAILHSGSFCAAKVVCWQIGRDYSCQQCHCDGSPPATCLCWSTQLPGKHAAFYPHRAAAGVSYGPK